MGGKPATIVAPSLRPSLLLAGQPPSLHHRCVPACCWPASHHCRCPASHHRCTIVASQSAAGQPATIVAPSLRPSVLLASQPPSLYHRCVPACCWPASHRCRCPASHHRCTIVASKFAAGQPATIVAPSLRPSLLLASQPPALHNRCVPAC